MNGTSEFQIAAQTDRKIVKSSFKGTNSKKISEGLSRMLMTTVTGVETGIEEAIEATSGAPSFG